MSTYRIRREIDLIRRCSRLLHRSGVRSVLGPDDPLTRSSELVHTVAVQAITTAGTTAVAAVAVAERVSWAATVFRAASILELALIVILIVRSSSREKTSCA